MREMIIKAWCDRCEALGQPRTEARHLYTVGIVKGEARPALKVIELCDSCDSTEIDMLSKILADHSLPVDRAKLAPAAHTPDQSADYIHPRVECRICGNQISKSSLVSHIWATHRPGETKPSHPARCPDCHLVSPNMGMHRARAHGWSAIDQAYEGLVP